MRLIQQEAQNKNGCLYANKINDLVHRENALLYLKDNVLFSFHCIIPAVNSMRVRNSIKMRAKVSKGCF